MVAMSTIAQTQAEAEKLHEAFSKMDLEFQAGLAQDEKDLKAKHVRARY